MIRKLQGWQNGCQTVSNAIRNVMFAQNNIHIEL